MALPPTSPGRLKLHGYQILRQIGTGAGSTLWEGIEEATGKRVAIKRVIRQREAAGRYFEQAENEYRIARQIDHPNVRKMIRMFRKRGLIGLRQLHLVMEFCPGHSVEQNTPTDLPEICDIFAQTANALERINEAGFVHADIKPNNIIVDHSGNVRLIDMGQSCPIGTIKDRIQGTPDYISPEQVHCWPLTIATDVFNWGATLYWALTGKPIPTVLPQQGALKDKTSPKIVPPNKLNNDIPDSLNGLVLECIQQDPKARPPRASLLSRRLGMILQDELER